MLINFVIAEDFSIKPKVFYNVTYSGQLHQEIENAIDNMKLEHSNVIITGSESDVRKKCF